MQDTFVHGTMSGGTALGNPDDNLIQSINQTTSMLTPGDTLLFTRDNHKAKKSTDQSVFYTNNELDPGNDYSEMLVNELMNPDPCITDEECFKRINNIMHDGKAQDGQPCAIFGTTGFAVIINNKLYATPSNERWRRPHDAGKSLEHFQQQLRDAGVSDSDIQQHTNGLVAREQWPIHGLDAEEIEVMKNHFRERMMGRFDNDALQSTVEKRLTLLGNAASGELDVRLVKPNPGVRQVTMRKGTETIEGYGFLKFENSNPIQEANNFMDSVGLSKQNIQKIMDKDQDAQPFLQNMVLQGLAFDYCVGNSGLQIVQDRLAEIERKFDIELGVTIIIPKETTKYILPESKEAMEAKLESAGIHVVDQAWTNRNELVQKFASIAPVNTGVRRRGSVVAVRPYFRRMNSQGHLSDKEAAVMSTECRANVAECIAYFEELIQEKQRLGDPLSTSQNTR